MNAPEYRCTACAAVYPAQSWGDCGACPGCGCTASTHVDPPQLAKADELGAQTYPVQDLTVTIAGREITGFADGSFVVWPTPSDWEIRARRAEARCAELEARLEAIRRAAR